MTEDMDATDIDGITDVSSFVVFLRRLAEVAETYNRTLEEYLRGVLSAVMARKDDAPTWQLLAQIFADGITYPFMPFDPAWLAVTDPPAVWKPEIEMFDSFDVALQMLHYQIADLHKFAEIERFYSPHRYLGITSPTGHKWFNFEPSIFLEAASRCMNGGENTAEYSWLDLAITLWMGQIYE